MADALDDRVHYLDICDTIGINKEVKYEPVRQGYFQMHSHTVSPAQLYKGLSHIRSFVLT